MAVEHRSPKKFAMEIEEIVTNHGLSYMDAVLHFCDERDIEPDAIKGLVNKQLKEKIEVEAVELHFFPAVGKLPV